jgi:hypothetical protein
MSEYRKQIVAGSLIAVIMALVLAVGASYLFPQQTTGGGFSLTTSPPGFTTTETTTSPSYIASGSPKTSSGTTSAQPDTTTFTGASTSIVINSPAGTTVTITMTETEASATVTVGQIVSTTTVITEQIQITDVNAISASQITITALNFGNVDETLTDILVNGNPLSSVNGGTSSPSLPITIASGGSQVISLNFSSPLPSGTYVITVLTRTG